MLTLLALCFCYVSRWIQKCADAFKERWHGIVHVVEDTSIVDLALADLSSTKVANHLYSTFKYLSVSCDNLCIIRICSMSVYQMNKQVRRLMKQKKNVEHLVGETVYRYIKKYKILEKMHPRNPEEWSNKDSDMRKLKTVVIPTPSVLARAEDSNEGNGNTHIETTSDTTT